MDIEIKNLSVSFPEGKEQRRVLNPVSLTLKPVSYTHLTLPTNSLV